MKKRGSVIALGLRLTWVVALFCVVLTCVLQGWLFWRQQSMWGGVEFESYTIGFEHIIENDGIAHVGKWGFFALLIGLTACCASGQTGMTLRRLRIREWEVTAWWTMIFFGYFLLFWAVQLGMLLWTFHMYAQVRGWDLMDLFISAHTSPYFHIVLPLSEPWAVVRNIFLCLSWALTAALGALEARRGGKPFTVLVVGLSTNVFLPTTMASAVGDMAAISILGCILAGYIWAMHGRVKNED